MAGTRPVAPTWSSRRSGSSHPRVEALGVPALPASTSWIRKVPSGYWWTVSRLRPARTWDSRRSRRLDESRRTCRRLPGHQIGLVVTVELEVGFPGSHRPHCTHLLGAGNGWYSSRHAGAPRPTSGAQVSARGGWGGGPGRRLRLPSFPVATGIAADQAPRARARRSARGWHPCKQCGLAVPLRETWCSLCLWERWVAGEEAGWQCVQCGKLMTGRRLHARYCGRLVPGGLDMPDGWRQEGPTAAADGPRLPQPTNRACGVPGRNVGDARRCSRGNHLPERSAEGNEPRIVQDGPTEGPGDACYSRPELLDRAPVGARVVSVKVAAAGTMGT